MNEFLHEHGSHGEAERRLGIEKFEWMPEGWYGTHEQAAAFYNIGIFEWLNAIGCVECERRYSAGEIDYLAVER